jgi:alpha-L-fucosidase
MINILTRNRVAEPPWCLALALAGAMALVAGTLLAAEVADVPVFKENARILFQGDSITDGNRGRNEDPNHILGHGYCFIIAAKFGAQYPERKLSFLNRGISGNKVTDLAARWQKDTLDLKPDVLSILIGINDSGHIPLEEYEEVYDKLLVDAKAANPSIHFILCEPFYLPKDGHKEGDEREQDVKKRQAVVAKLAEKHRAALVRFQQVFDDACKRAPAQYWVWDSVHPTYSGHQLMADEWMRTVRQFYGASAPAANDRATNPRPASPEQMQWFRDAKFGLFIHWGPASLSGAEISWGRKDRIEGGGQELQQVPAEVYDNLYKQFNPVKFDADQWMALAKEAGCRYVVFITKHHDGFSMWPTEQVRWTAPGWPKHYSIADTPFGRDLCQEIADAARKHGLRLGWYYSTRDWTHPDYLKGDNRLYNTYYEAQVRELLTRYGTVDIMWFDHAFGDWSQFTIEHLFKTIYQAQPNLLVNNRAARGLQHIPAGAMQQLTEADYDTPEQQIGHFQTNRAWESCVTMTKCRNDSGGWSYRPGEPTRSYEECVRMLVSTVTGDGNLLLNVGPLPTGEILPEQVEVLKRMGAWLRKHGSSIYDTRGGPFANGEWGGSTQRGDKIWLHVLHWSGGDVLRLPPLKDTIQSALTLDGAKPKTAQNGSGLEITLPKAQQDSLDTIIELTLERN